MSLLKNAGFADNTSLKILMITALPDDLIRLRLPLLKALLESGHSVAVCAAAKDNLAGVLGLDVPEEMAKIGIPYYSYVLDRAGINPLSDIRTFRDIYRICRLVQPDLVISYNAKPIVFGSFAAKAAGVKRILSQIPGLSFGISPHSDNKGLAVTITRLLYKSAISLNETVIFQNDDDRMELVSSRLIPKRVSTGVVNGSGVDTSRYQQVPFPDGHFVFLTIARLLKEKGLMELAEAARQVKAIYPLVEFHLVGPSDDQHSDAISVETVRGWENEGILKWFGPTSNVRQYIEKSHVYVLPSYHEGMPRTVLEAMAMGRPIITTTAPGCRQTVREGENGFLVPVRDTAQLAQKIMQFIKEPDLIPSMGSISRERALNEFDSKKVAASVMNLMFGRSN